MNIEFVNPFLVSIINVLATMAKTEAKPDKPFLKIEKSAKGDVTGIVGLMEVKLKLVENNKWLPRGV
jgi:chemotaxis protein CheX